MYFANFSLNVVILSYVGPTAMHILMLNDINITTIEYIDSCLFTFALPVRFKSKSNDLKDEASRAAKQEKEKKDAMANIDINNYASMSSAVCHS